MLQHVCVTFIDVSEQTFHC